MDNVFENNFSDAECILGLVMIAQPFVMLFQMACSVARWHEYKRANVMNKRIRIYWGLLALYMVAGLPCYLHAYPPFPYFGECLYDTYWLIWLYYCIKIRGAVNRKKLKAAGQTMSDIAKWGF